MITLTAYTFIGIYTTCIFIGMLIADYLLGNKYMAKVQDLRDALVVLNTEVDRVAARVAELEANQGISEADLDPVLKDIQTTTDKVSTIV